MSDYPTEEQLKNTSQKHRDGTTTVTIRSAVYKNGHSAWEGWKVGCSYELLAPNGDRLIATKDKTRIKRIREHLADPEIGLENIYLYCRGSI